jgi:phosphohistidine phosphatase
MDIYLIRHGKAVALGEQGIDNDDERPLTDEGVIQARQLADTLRHRGIELDVVLTTPLLRARRTAEILLENWHGDPAPELIVENRLAPECKPRKLIRVLRDIQKERVAVVGHQPDLGTWASWLIGSKKAYINFAKAGAAHIVWERDLKKGGGALIWLITPAWFDRHPATTPHLAATGD